MNIEQDNKNFDEQGDDDMSNRIPAKKKLAIIEENLEILSMIYHVSNGFILTKQLHLLLDAVGYGSSVSNQKAITEMLKTEVLTKKQALGKSNILIMTSASISYFTGTQTKDVNLPSTTDKAILKSIQAVEIIINNLPIMQNFYQRENLSALEIRTYMEEVFGTYTLLPKDILQYYTYLDESYESNFWSQSFYDDISVLRVQKQNRQKALAKYIDIQIDPEDQKIYDELSWVKENASLSQEQYKQQYFNFYNLISSSCDINYITLDNPYRLNSSIVIYDNGSLVSNPDRIAKIAAHTYLALKRYVNSYQTKVYLEVNVTCADEETLHLLKEECERRADLDENYGYRNCNRITSLMYNHGCRFPDCTSNVTWHFHTQNITDKYGIETK